MTLLLLVDALRPDYVGRAPWLRSLAGRSATGALRECFGFVPRAAYFGGLDAAQYAVAARDPHRGEARRQAALRHLPLRQGKAGVPHEEMTAVGQEHRQ